MKKGLLIFGIGLVGLLAVMIIAGWEDGGMIARAKAVVQANIYDPDSAQFRDLIVIGTSDSTKRTVCGKVNAKNKFGGYVGYASFIYREPSYGLIIAGQKIAGQVFDEFDIEQTCQQAKADDTQARLERSGTAGTAMSGTKKDAAKARPSSSCFGPEDCKENSDYVSFGTAGTDK
jgi:hypothetical protein